VERLEQLVAHGVVLSEDEFLTRVGWSKQLLESVLAANRIFCVESDNVRFFPAFFSDRRYELGQLRTVSYDLGNLPGEAKLRFFLSRRDSLAGTSALEALQRGQLETVRQAALAFRDG